jgi:hypothetical protein
MVTRPAAWPATPPALRPRWSRPRPRPIRKTQQIRRRSFETSADETRSSDPCTGRPLTSSRRTRPGTARHLVPRQGLTARVRLLTSLRSSRPRPRSPKRAHAAVAARAQSRSRHWRCAQRRCSRRASDLLLTPQGSTIGSTCDLSTTPARRSTRSSSRATPSSLSTMIRSPPSRRRSSRTKRS